MSWTTERVDLLKELWAMGLSASQIAGRINAAWPWLKPVTRNAVIGKRIRLELPDRLGNQNGVGCAAIKRIRKRKADVAKARTRVAVGNPAFRDLLKADGYVPPREEIVVPENERRGVAGVLEDQCRWPMADPQDPKFYFCNRSQIPGQSYCRAHLMRAFETIAMRRSMSAPEKETADA